MHFVYLLVKKSHMPKNSSQPLTASEVSIAVRTTYVIKIVSYRLIHWFDDTQFENSLHACYRAISFSFPFNLDLPVGNMLPFLASAYWTKKGFVTTVWHFRL